MPLTWFELNWIALSWIAQRNVAANATQTQYDTDTDTDSITLSHHLVRESLADWYLVEALSSLPSSPRQISYRTLYTVYLLWLLYSTPTHTPTHACAHCDLTDNAIFVFRTNRCSNVWEFVTLWFHFRSSRLVNDWRESWSKNGGLLTFQNLYSLHDIIRTSIRAVVSKI